MARVGSLTAVVTADTKQFSASMAKAKMDVVSFGQTVDTRISTAAGTVRRFLSPGDLGKVARGFTAVGIAMGTVVASFQTGKKLVDAIDESLKSATQKGVEFRTALIGEDDDKRLKALSERQRLLLDQKKALDIIAQIPGGPATTGDPAMREKAAQNYSDLLQEIEDNARNIEAITSDRDRRQRAPGFAAVKEDLKEARQGLLEDRLQFATKGRDMADLSRQIAESKLASDLADLNQRMQDALKINDSATAAMLSDLKQITIDRAKAEIQAIGERVWKDAPTALEEAAKELKEAAEDLKNEQTRFTDQLLQRIAVSSERVAQITDMRRAPK